MNISDVLNHIKLDQAGLMPAIVQDYKNKQVLMLAYMSPESLRLTLREKKTWFYSRSRKKLWLKGETSGNFQKVKEVYLDCDNDAVLIKVEQLGKAACHTGEYSCFHNKLDLPHEDHA